MVTAVMPVTPRKTSGKNGKRSQEERPTSVMRVMMLPR